jgi:hypothetical protein
MPPMFGFGFGVPQGKGKNIFYNIIFYLLI